MSGDRFEYIQKLEGGGELVTRYLVDSAIWSRGILVRYTLIDQSGETVVRDSKALHDLVRAGRLKFF